MNISFDTTQFEIVFVFLTSFIFFWYASRINDLDVDTQRFHYVPFSKGLFIMFAGFMVISLALKTGYLNLLSFVPLTTVGIVVVVYGVLRAFYY